ncbi:hypothetical protein AAES_75172 [Amazona aestiva]|uniref:Uncharacterized protein n=1 Tax=Amazona aestiva TaxID=12930 RepID=A0A0Q3USH8_AMAAE|nr:hypothetical protein AAES_75172 [Amazona aestiva]
MKSERAAAASAVKPLSLANAHPHPCLEPPTPPPPPTLPASQLPAEPPTKGSKNPNRSPFDHYTGGRTYPKIAKTIKRGFQAMPNKERSKSDIATDPDDIKPLCEVKVSTDYKPGAPEYSLTFTPNRSPIDSNVSTPEEAEKPKELNDSTKELLQEASRYPTVWRLITDSLKDMQAEEGIVEAFLSVNGHVSNPALEMRELRW